MNKKKKQKGKGRGKKESTIIFVSNKRNFQREKTNATYVLKVRGELGFPGGEGSGRWGKEGRGR